MAVFFAYLKYRLGTILCFVVFGVVFSVVFFLFDAYVPAVLYSCLLCFFLGAVFLGLDFLYFLRKHKCLRTLLNSISFTLDGLPMPNNLIEDDYRALLRAVND